MIAGLLKAHERDEFIAAVRALDRVLMSGFYVVPLYHLPAQWVARWTTTAHPDQTWEVSHVGGDRFAANVVVGFLPAALLGVLFGNAIKAQLFTPLVVATTFILGAFVILWAERRAPSAVRVQTMDDMTFTDALKVGFAQCFALIPGTSRSGATIIGGMLFGLSRKAATDFSFFLAMPTLIGAGVYSLYKERAQLTTDDGPMFAVGLLFAFLSAWLSVRWLLRYIATHSFVPFAWYRIVFGGVVLVTWWAGWVKWVQ